MKPTLFEKVPETVIWQILGDLAVIGYFPSRQHAALVWSVSQPLRALIRAFTHINARTTFSVSSACLLRVVTAPRAPRDHSCCARVGRVQTRTPAEAHWEEFAAQTPIARGGTGGRRRATRLARLVL